MSYIAFISRNMLVSQDEQHVEVYRRSTNWMQERFATGQTIELEQLNLELPVEAIYVGVLMDVEEGDGND